MGNAGTRGMFTRIPGNVEENSGECRRRFRVMFERIPGNLNLDYFVKSCLLFYQILQLNCEETKEYFLRYQLLLKTNLLRLNTVFLPHFSFSISFSCGENGVVTRCRGIKKL